MSCNAENFSHKWNKETESISITFVYIGNGQVGSMQNIVVAHVWL